MKSKVNIAAVVLIIGMVSLGCGDSDESTSEIEEVNPTSPAHLELTTEYTIGVELGDTNYVFGQIVEALPNENGDVLVLDLSSMNVRLFSSVGEFIGSAGRQGTGCRNGFHQPRRYDPF